MLSYNVIVKTKHWEQGIEERETKSQRKKETKKGKKTEISLVYKTITVGT